MAIGEFGGAAKLPGTAGLLSATPMYWLYEMSQAALNPSRAVADATRLFFKNPPIRWRTTTFGKSVAAACEVFERSTRRYRKPEWRIRQRWSAANRFPCMSIPCGSARSASLLHFERVFEHAPRRPQPRC